jgi:hypothetical protein
MVRTLGEDEAAPQPVLPEEPKLTPAAAARAKALTAKVEAAKAAAAAIAAAAAPSPRGGMRPGMGARGGAHAAGPASPPVLPGSVNGRPASGAKGPVLVRGRVPDHVHGMGGGLPLSLLSFLPSPPPSHTHTTHAHTPVGSAHPTLSLCTLHLSCNHVPLSSPLL